MMSDSTEYSIFVAAGPQVLESILKLVDGSKRLSIADTALNGEECLEKLAAADAGIAFIDFALPQISGVKVIEYLSTNHPEVISVLLSDRVNPEYFRSGMLAGAREFITLPVTTEELEFAVERVAQVAGAGKKSRSLTQTFETRPRPDARVIVVGSGKGGVGTSFVAANLAKLMADADPDLDVALVDLNCRANDLAVIVNVEPGKTLKDFVPVIADLDPALIRSVAQNVAKKLALFAAPPEAELAGLFTAEQLRLLIDGLRSCYDFVVIDSGAYADRAGASLHEAADLIMIILTPEILAVRGGKRFIDCLERFGISKNSMMAVINRWGPLSLSPERIAEYIGAPVMEKLPESDLVRLLLDEGRLLQAGDRSEVKHAFDQLIAAVRQKLSLGDGISVH
ncbi:MAG: response regulator [Actinomycetota bacterium]|nr:response regulator [Actinomycetota bacterium]